MNIVFLDGFTLSLHNDLDISKIFGKYGDVRIYSDTDKSRISERIKNADIVFTNKVKINKQDVQNAKRLKYIGVLATGYNIIGDLDSMSKRGITVTNIPNYSTNGVAELAFALIFELAKKTAEHNKAVKAGQWQQSKSFTLYSNGIFELCNKTMGIIGYGNIGKKVAKIAGSFDMNVLVYTRTPKKEDETSRLKFVSLDDLLADSDIISIHCPLTDQTKLMFNRETLNKLKNGAVLINTARGPIVDEQAVFDALECAKLAGFGADVVSAEPIKANNPLLKAKNCILTPHIAWANFETRVRLLKMAENNLKSFLEGNPINKVNF